jgi:hypothetical protein
MSKFYVTCGSQSLVVTAPSPKHAALRLLDEVLATHLWIYEDAGLDEQDRHDHLVLEALLHLGSAVMVSERGLGNNEAGIFEVPELLTEWHKLMTGISRLLVVAGLDPRRVLPKVIGNSLTPRKAR